MANYVLRHLSDVSRAMCVWTTNLTVRLEIRSERFACGVVYEIKKLYRLSSSIPVLNPLPDIVVA